MSVVVLRLVLTVLGMVVGNLSVSTGHHGGTQLVLGCFWYSRSTELEVPVEKPTDGYF